MSWQGQKMGQEHRPGGNAQVSVVSQSQPSRHIHIPVTHTSLCWKVASGFSLEISHFISGARKMIDFPLEIRKGS